MKMDLKLYLADYILDNIKDNKLKTAIENEININLQFRAEYYKLKNTIAFLNISSFTEPSESYFNSLLPKINSKIDLITKDTSIFKIFTFWFENHWKYLLPVIPVLIILLIYHIEFNKTVNTGEEINIITMRESLSTGNKYIVNDTIQKLNENPKENENTSNDLSSKNNSVSNYINKPAYKENNSQISVDETDPEETDIFVNEEDILKEENELFELNEEYQTEILNNLKNEKF